MKHDRTVSTANTAIREQNGPIDTAQFDAIPTAELDELVDELLRSLARHAAIFLSDDQNRDSL